MSSGRVARFANGVTWSRRRRRVSLRFGASSLWIGRAGYRENMELIFPRVPTRNLLKCYARYCNYYRYFFYFFSNARKLPCELKRTANPCNSFFRSSGFTFLEWVCSFVLLITLKFCTIQTDIHVCICFFFNWRVSS